MTSERSDASELANAQRIRAEAAAWIAQLHGPQRTPAMEAGLRRWLAEQPEHADAFELATDVWHESGSLVGSLPRESQRPVPTHGKPITRGPFLAAVAAFCAVFVGLAAYYYYYFGSTGVVTGTGEQRTLILADGTRVELNTQTRLVVQYDDHERRVILKHGEAYFEVAKHQPRPFVVIAGARKVIAVGTAFIVRREEAADAAFTVTLIEGRVAVAPTGNLNTLPVETTPDVQMMSAGERVRFRARKPPERDKPAMDRETSWMQGQLIFDDTRLRDAVAEFNRYGPIRIVVESAEADESIRVGGVFRIGDSVSFARAIAETYQMELSERGDQIVLRPSQAGASLPNE